MQALLWFLERKWLSPLLTATILFSGIFVVEDFAALKSHHPDWAGAISLINPTLFIALFAAGVSEFILAVARAYLEPTITSLKTDLGNAYSEIDQIGSAIRDVFDGMLYTFSKRLELNQSDHANSEAIRPLIPK